jgi:hypothetical protein
MLWQRLRMAKFLLRRAPVGVELAREGTGASGEGTGAAGVSPDGPAYRITAKNATPAVTVIGSPAELTLWAMGRATAAKVRFDGIEAAVNKLTEANWR